MILGKMGNCWESSTNFHFKSIMASEQRDNWQMARVELGVCRSLFKRVAIGPWPSMVVTEMEKKKMDLRCIWEVEVMGQSYLYREINVDIQHLYHFPPMGSKKFFNYFP